MSEALTPSEYDARLEVLQERKIFTHRSSGSFGSAMNLGSHHPVFRYRCFFGDPYTYSLIDPHGDIHRCPGVYAPIDQQIILQARKQNGLSEVDGRLRVQDPTGDALLVHAPNPYERGNEYLADYHVQAWRQDIQQAFNINPVVGVLFYMRQRSVTIADYRTDDVHVITAFPERYGHTIQSATEGFSPAIPHVEVERMAF